MFNGDERTSLLKLIGWLSKKKFFNIVVDIKDDKKEGKFE